MRYTRRTRTPLSGRLSLLAPLLLSGLATTAQAQITNTWTGLGADSNWSTTANWDANGVPTSAAATGLDFTGSAAAANNDLGTFALNIMQFDVMADITVSGNDLNFVSNGSALPTLTQNTAFSLTLNNNLTLTNNLTLNLAGSGNVNLAGVISGAGSLTIAGSNAAYTTILSNSNNSYTGGTIITGGTLQLGTDNALPSGKDLLLTGTLANASLDLNGHNVTVGNISFADGTGNSLNQTSITDSSSGSTGLLTLNGNITYNPGNDSNLEMVTPTAVINSNVVLSAGQHVINNSENLDYSTQSYDVILSGAVSGKGGLDIGVVSDTTLPYIYSVLAHTNTYTGPTNIINGTLFLGVTNALPMQSAVTVGSGGNLFLYLSSDLPETGLKTGSYNQTIGSLADGSLGGGFVNLGGATLTVGSDNTSTTFSGVIRDNDGMIGPTVVGGSLVKVGTGTLNLGGVSTYTGSTSIYAGTLQLGTNNALPTGTASEPATDLTLYGGAFDMNSHSQTLNNLTNNGGSVLVQGAASTLTVNGAYKQSSGTTQVDTTLNFTPGLDLTVTGGQLVGTGTIGNATGSGTITITNSGGTVRPGDLLPSIGTGTLSVNGNYTQTSGGKLEIDLGGTGQGSTYDLLTVLNTASLGGELDIKLVNGFSPTLGEQFDILSYGARSGGFNGSPVSLDPGFNYTVSYNDQSGMVVLTAVPEGSTLFSAMLVVGMGGLLLRRQRLLGKLATISSG